eukprot:m.168008 g.168008  ORF g.168008 m.168008 type:complete len:403 (+) comp12909_c0_seq1:286-1494(+)
MAASYAANEEPMYDQAPGSYLHVTPDETVPAQFDNPLYFQSRQEAALKEPNYRAVEPDWLSDQEELLSVQDWFRGHQSREAATAELRGKPYGTFVVRVSQSQPGHYAISVTQPKGMDHMLILPTFADDPAAPGLTRYRLGTHSRDLFNTIPKLIAYYIDHEYLDVRRLQGTVVPEAQPGGYMDINPHADTWDQGEIDRTAAETQLRNQPAGAFILRTKKGAGYVLSMAVPAPKNFMHHLVTWDDDQFVIDGVPVGAFTSVHELIETLMDDTLSCISTPLINIFGNGAQNNNPYPEPQYDTAGEAMARAVAVGAVHDMSAYNSGGDLDPLYDEAHDDNGYLGVEPPDPYPDLPRGAGQDPLYSEDAYGGQLDPLADDYDQSVGAYGTAHDALPPPYGAVDEDL